VDSSILDPDKIKAIQEWKIEFSTIDNQIEKTSKDSTITTNLSSLAIQFLEDIKFELLGEYGVKIIESTNGTCGFIRLNIVEHYAHAQLTKEIKSASLTLYDNSNTLLGRIKVISNSSPSSPTFFAKDCAKELSKIL
jgi:hypothetical protein